MTERLFDGTVELRDAIEGLRTIEDGAVDLVLSDLPAGVTKAPTDRPPDFERLWPELWRVLRKDGAIVLLAATMKFAVDVIDSQREEFRYDLVWEKSRATDFFNSKRRPMRAHEFVLVFYRDFGTFNVLMSIGHPPIKTAYRKADTGHGKNYGVANRGGHESRSGATDRFPRSVIYTHVIANGPRRRHHQEKPQELLRWLVQAYSNPGDLVVDPYAGSGSAGEAARSLRRLFRGFDDDPEYGRAPYIRSRTRKRE